MGKHYVPQKYLQGFAVPEDQRLIWMYDKKTQRWSRPAIKDIAQERDYFPPEHEAQLTHEIESPANIVLDRLRTGGELSAEDRDIMENYVGVMLMRVPYRRRKTRALVPEVRDATFARLRKEFETLSSPEQDISALLRELDRLEEVYQSQLPESVVQEMHSPWPTAKILGAIREMTWRIVSAQPPHFFITSDNPAYFFPAYGLGTENSELTFPISSGTAILGSHRGPARSTLEMRVRAAIQKEVNRRIVSGAERFIFTPFKKDWIQTIADKTKPYLSRIEW